MAPGMVHGFQKKGVFSSMDSMDSVKWGVF